MLLQFLISSNFRDFNRSEGKGSRLGGTESKYESRYLKMEMGKKEEEEEKD